MAEPKKDFKKPEGPTGIASSSTVVSTLAAFIVGLLLLGYILAKLFAYLDSQNVAPWDALTNLFYRWWPRLKVIAVIVSIFSAVWAIYSRLKIKEIEKEEEKIYGSASTGLLQDLKEELGQEPLEKQNEKWLRVTEHINSESPSDWRLAIIEADVMLEEFLRKDGYHGDSVGDMLKAVEPGEIQTIDAAWEAHKVRNRIAHSGGDFELNEREARRVIALFEQVFQEVGII